MKTKTDSFTLATLPALTEKQLNQLETLAKLAHDTVDLTEMAELTDAELSEMRPVAFYRPVKQQITARVDADVLAWLKSQGRGYQSRINAILRREMLEQRQTK